VGASDIVRRIREVTKHSADTPYGLIIEGQKATWGWKMETGESAGAELQILSTENCMLEFGAQYAGFIVVVVLSGKNERNSV